MNHEILKGRNCFITGATGGLGRYIALEMAQYKCNLFLTSTNSSKLKALKNEIELLQKRGSRVHYHHGDLNKLEDIDGIISAVRKELTSIDILISCAGIFIVKSLTDSNMDDFDHAFNLNFRAPFLFCKEFSKDMKEQRWGRIVNIGSSSSYAGSKETSLYCASKHAVLGFSRALHEELKANNVRTYCVSPSGIKTEMGKQIPNQTYSTFLDPREIAEYVAFICCFNGEMISDEIRLNRMEIK